jgi:hypothetical protein
MSTQGLATTFRVLTEADSPSALRLLVAGLEHRLPAIQRESLVGLLRRRNPAGQREILRRWTHVAAQWLELLREHRDRMGRAVRDAVLSVDPHTCAVGCEAAVALEQYDLVPALLTALLAPANPSADAIGTTILRLADRLYDELATPPKRRSRRRDPQLVREHLVQSLESGVNRFSRHKCRDVIEAFLVLAGRDNLILKLILQNPQHSEYPAVVDLLSKSPRPGVIRLLLSFLDDPLPPSAALAVLGHRSDPHFVRHLLRKVGHEQSPLIRQNLKRLTAVSWLRIPRAMLDVLDDEAQRGMVRLTMSVGIPRDQCFSIVECVLQHGRPAGRCAAAEALADFSGAEANALAIRALDDPDPLVQAAVLVQLRARRIPGALPRLVDMVESPHPVVRQAARKGLAEFSFKRFLAAFDVLDDEVRRSTGMLVKKVDPQCVPLIQAEMRSLVRSRRLRGLVIARTLEVVPELQSTVLELLCDDDHLIRTEAALALGNCHTDAARQALEAALDDHSPVVQEAIAKSLQAIRDANARTNGPHSG